MQQKSEIKIAYLTHALGFESALSQLEKLGMSASAADDFLFAKDDDFRVAAIKNGDVKEGPAMLAGLFNRRH